MKGRKERIIVPACIEGGREEEEEGDVEDG